MRFETLTAVKPRARKLDECQVIVCGNEKGGSGKSTIAMHIAISLVNLGFKVATVDLDTRQQSLTRFSNYRRRWMQNASVEIECPDHFSLHHEAAMLYEISTEETCSAFDSIVTDWRRSFDFIVVDTPGSFTMLSTAAHRQADTLITPINDSFVDFDVLANIDPLTFEVDAVAQYASSVREARRIRQSESQNSGRGILDWIVVRNRMSNISSRNERRVEECLRALSMQLGFRVADGITERVVYRESFIRGLTAIDETSGQKNGLNLSMSHLAARNEVRALVSALQLPIDELGLKRAQARKKWLRQRLPILKVPDIFAEESN